MARPHSLEHLTGHVVICNCNAKVGKIIEELQTGVVYEPPDVVLIIQDEDLWLKNPEWHPPASMRGRFYTVTGCPTDKNDLRRVGIQNALTAVILADPNHGELADAPSTLTAMAIEKQNPQVHTVIELFASGNRRHLKAAEVNEVICMREITEKLIVQSSLNPGIKNIFQDLLTFRQGSSQLYTLNLPHHLDQLTYRQLARKIILAESPFILIGFVKNSFSPQESVFTQQAKALTGEAGEKTPAGGFVPPHPDAGTLHHDLSQIVINPKANRKPGKDTRLSSRDRLVIIGHEQPDFDGVAKEG